MRSQDEIVARMEARKLSDLFGFEVGEYVNYLDYANAKEFLKPDTTKEQWEENKSKPPDEVIRAYMPFAWEKANDCRGISANRSIMHMIAWLWLDGKDWLDKEADENYRYYGKPQLVRICEEYSINWRVLDDNRWRNDEDSKPISADKAMAK